jgi:hypothetical protein
MIDRLLIPIERTTAQKIKQMKITKWETYDEIINRIVKELK